MHKLNFYLSFTKVQQTINETLVDKLDKIDAFCLKVLLAFVFTLQCVPQLHVNGTGSYLQDCTIKFKYGEDLFLFLNVPKLFKTAQTTFIQRMAGLMDSINAYLLTSETFNDRVLFYNSTRKHIQIIINTKGCF